ncbi:hypothetical protein GF342_02555 [Candidatus Woesearchaeota archaeon]|nr:hypothetical protein [Candidatus Woesearchaeota archaeon]
MIIFSHRANGYGFLENSRNAIQHALASDVDGIEIDLRLTKDNHYVVCHDAYLDRVSRGTGLLRKKTAAQLQKERLLDGQGLLFFNEFLQLLQTSNKQCIIELKDNGQEQEVITQLKKHHLLKQCFLASWNPHALEKIRHLSTQAQTLLYYVPVPRFLRFITLSRKKMFDGDEVTIGLNTFSAMRPQDFTVLLSSYVPQLSCNGIGIPHVAIQPHVIKACKTRGLHLITYAVNNTSTYTRLRALGLYGVISDRPRSLYAARSGDSM